MSFYSIFLCYYLFIYFFVVDLLQHVVVCLRTTVDLFVGFRVGDSNSRVISIR